MNIVFSDDSAHLSAELVSLFYAFASLVGGKAKGRGGFEVEYEIIWFRIFRKLY